MNTNAVLSLLLLSAATVSASSAATAAPKTRDYNITVAEGFDTQACADQIDALPSSEITGVLAEIAVVTAKLSKKSAALALELECVGSVEKDRPVGPAHP